MMGLRTRHPRLGSVILPAALLAGCASSSAQPSDPVDSGLDAKGPKDDGQAPNDAPSSADAPSSGPSCGGAGFPAVLTCSASLASACASLGGCPPATWGAPLGGWCASHPDKTGAWSSHVCSGYLAFETGYSSDGDLLFLYDATSKQLVGAVLGGSSKHFTCVGGDSSVALDTNACFHWDPIGNCANSFNAGATTFCASDRDAGETDGGRDAGHD